MPPFKPRTPPKVICKLPAEEVARVKGLGCLWDKRTEDSFNFAVLLMGMVLSTKMNLLCLGDAIARSLGVRVRLVRALALMLASASAAAAVSFAGLLGFVGLMVPHIARKLTADKRDYQGRILLGNQDVRGISRTDLARMVACLPQNLPCPRVTVRDMVSFGRTPYTPMTGKLSVQDKEKIRWAIHAVGMEGGADAYVDTLSGGERKKAFFAMTLAQDTPVVVLDEPTAHLDSASRFAFLELIETMCRQTGKTFLVVMHDLPEVLRCADRIVTLHERKLAFDGTPGQCLASDVAQICFQIQIRGDKEHGYAVTPLK